MNPLLVEHNITTFCFALGVMGGLIRIMFLDLRSLVSNDFDITLTLGFLILLVATSGSWDLFSDMLAGAACMGLIVLGIKWWYERRFGSGDCLVYPPCGFATGFSSMTSWLLWLSALLIMFPVGWALWRGKSIRSKRFRRMIFPGTPPAIMAVFLTWGTGLNW